MRQLTSIGAVVLMTLASTDAARASATIDTLSLWDGERQVGAVGEPNTAYVGQSFRALDERITSLSFVLDGLDDVENNEPDTTDFHVLVAPLAPSGDRPDLDNILFESTVYSTTLESSYELFVVDMDVAVEPGNSYMWIIDAFVAFDGTAGTAAIAATYDMFSDGEFRVFNLREPPNVGTRVDHDDYQWLIVQPPSAGDIPTVDAAFAMTFVPEPASICMLLFLAVATSGRNRRGHRT